MCEVNAKQELLKVLKDNNLEILEIDCSNRDAASYLFYKEKGTSSQFLLDYYKGLSKYYKSILDFDFNYDPCNDDIEGKIYCIDKDTKEPYWLTRWRDEACSGWQVNGVPRYFIEHKIISYG